MSPIETGKFIRRKRKELKLSQIELGGMLYVEPQTISKWERGLGMPDYDNLSRLKEIFNCSLSDILEPDNNQEDEVTEQVETQKNEIVVVEQKELKEEIKFTDYAKPKKLKKFIERVFGIDYMQIYNEKFLFKGVFKKRSKEEFENSITQGMFCNKTNHPVLGLQAPWMYLYAFIFMIACMGVTFLGALLNFGAPFIFVTALVSTLPLLVFLFESNFSRDMSIVSVFAIFMLGGICCYLIVALISHCYPTDAGVIGVVLAPFVEEIIKAIFVTIFIAKYKPKNILTGLLIGFAIGAGFSFFENLHYALASFSGDGKLEYIWIILLRSFFDFVIGHHYWTAIFAAFYTFYNSNRKVTLKNLFDWRVLLALAYAIGLHMLWNGTAWIWAVGPLSVGTLIILINVGIAQIKLKNIGNEYNADNDLYYS